MVSRSSFRIKPGGVYRLKFGKHRGKTLAECPAEYLCWLGDEAESPTLRALAKAALDIPEDDEDTAEPDPTSAAVAFPLIVFLWQEFMRAEFDTPFHLLVVETGLVKLKELCSGYTGKGWDLKKGGAA